MSAPKYDRSLLGDAIYWDGAAEAIGAALHAGDLMEVGRLLKHYADLSHAEEAAMDAASEALRYQPTPAGLSALAGMTDDAFLRALGGRLAVVPVR